MKKNNIRKMKIAMVTTQYLPVISGVSYYIKQLSEHLARLGNDVTVYTIGANGLKDEETINKVRIRRFLPSLKLFRGYEYVPKMTEAIIQDKPNIVNSHQYGYYPCVAGFKAAKKLCIPHILTPVLHPPKFSFGRTFLFNVYHNFQGSFVLKSSAAILALSNYEKNTLRKFGAPDSKIEVIYNPISKEFHPSTAKKEKYIVFVGPLGETKGADVAFFIAMRIAEKLKDVKFVFVGSGHLEAKFKAESQMFGKRFVFKSGITNSELASLFSKSTVMIAPTPYEAFGRAVAESQACGTSVVATRVGSLPEVIEDGKTGFLVEYGDWKTMEEKIIILLQNPGLARKLGMNAAKSMKRFSENAFVEKHLSIYRKCLGNYSETTK